MRRISDLLGHTIEVRSVVGKGSRFSVFVPLTNVGCAIESNPLPALWTFDPLLGASIGVIEDEASVRRDLEALLKQWGCLVFSAGSAIGLHQMISAGDLRLDAVISDFQLGKENGLEAIEQLRTRFGNVPAVLITSDYNSICTGQSPAVERKMLFDTTLWGSFAPPYLCEMNGDPSAHCTRFLGGLNASAKSSFFVCRQSSPPNAN